MGIIRGKIDNPFGCRGLPGPQTVTFGESPWYECSCGEFIDKETGEHIEVIRMTLEEFLANAGKCDKDE